jgi:ketosteroid isomerase-like protein
MKRLLLAVSMLLSTGTMAFAQGGVEKALLDLEQQWVKAQMAGDAQGLGAILAADFVSLQSDGTVQTKAVYLGNTAKWKWQASAVSDLKVQLHGDSAVVTGIWTGKGVDPTGKPFDSRERFADTWVKMPDGKWQCVASASATNK